MMEELIKKLKEDHEGKIKQGLIGLGWTPPSQKGPQTVLRCWFCGGEMIWGSDFDFEDIGYEGEGIVSSFSCQKCRATAEVCLRTDEEG